MSTRFDELGLSREILKAIEDMGFEEPTPIQALAIPHLMAGSDIIGQAQTGTGKTSAFGIPVLERIDPRSKGIQAIILCPTRELAIQVAEELGTLAAHKRGVLVLPVYGGQPIERQFRGLERGAQIVVGTPGRVMDHMKRGTIQLDSLLMAVLDEADEMLDMGFRDDIEEILSVAPSGCQQVFFSATMPPAIMQLARKYLNNPEVLKITQRLLTVPGIEQVYYELRSHQKMDALGRVLDSQGLRRVLVFCSTKRGVDELTAHLLARGYQADGLHGNLAQTQRDRVMGRFRSGGVDILVATDVAARGIDVDDVDGVINYDIPNDVESYVHRIGRTGRAGRAGKAFTFVTPRETYKLRDIMRYTKAKISHSQLPTLNDVVAIKTARLLDGVRVTMEEGALERHVGLIESFLDECDCTSMDMAAALLKLLMKKEFGEEQEEEKQPQGKRRKEDSSHSGSGVARLFFNVGSKMRVAPKDLVGAIAGETGMPGKRIGAIEIHDRFSFVEIPEDMADEVIRIMNGCQIRGYKVAVEIATPKH